MNLKLNTALAIGYRSAAQASRRMTEGWIAENMYCPRCGHNKVTQFENNRPVADFFCERCQNEYELKGKSTSIGNTVNDGAYDKMIERITSSINPDFFFMRYSIVTKSVVDLFVVPKYFFVPDMIKIRNPLTVKAQRSGWVGCNIKVSKIPEQGKIDIVKSGSIIPKEQVFSKLNLSYGLLVDNIESRGWLFDVLNCVNSIKSKSFDLQDMYSFVYALSSKHPNNNNVEAKIRQQLQFLRDKNIIRFLGNGKYEKV